MCSLCLNSVRKMHHCIMPKQIVSKYRNRILSFCVVTNQYQYLSTTIIDCSTCIMSLLHMLPLLAQCPRRISDRCCNTSSLHRNDDAIQDNFAHAFILQHAQTCKHVQTQPNAVAQHAKVLSCKATRALTCHSDLAIGHGHHVDNQRVHTLRSLL